MLLRLLLFLVALVYEYLVIEHFLVHFGFDLPALTLLLPLLIVLSVHQALLGVSRLLVVEQHRLAINI
jgi:hypothetical protein